MKENSYNPYIDVSKIFDKLQETYENS